MYSKHHLIISVVFGAAVGVLVGAAPPTLAAITGYAALLGVGIDLDHFLIARVRSGSWRAARAVLRHPGRSLREQSRIFDETEVRSEDRLLTHLVIGGLLTAGLAPFAPFWSLLSAGVVYTHLLTDAAWDVARAD